MFVQLKGGLPATTDLVAASHAFFDLRHTLWKDELAQENTCHLVNQFLHATFDLFSTLVLPEVCW